MGLSGEIIQMIKKIKPGINQISKDFNLYIDLGYDSLEFIYLLIEIENAYSINFDLMEMEKCLKIDYLINLVQNKLKGNKCD